MNNKFRTLLSCLLAIAMLITALPAYADDVTAELDLNGRILTISGSGAFSDSSKLNAELGYVTKIIVKEGVTSIGDSTLRLCENLEEVVLPEGLVSIGASAFSLSDKLAKINFPSTLATIGANAFEGCRSLTSISIPASVNNIGNKAFGNCESLNAINVDSQSSSFTSVDGVLYTKNMDTLVSYPAGKTDESFTIPSGIMSISQRAFTHNGHLQSVTFPPTLAAVSDFAFYYNRSLKSVTFGGNETRIGTSAFYGCAFESVVLPYSLTTIDGTAFKNCRSLALVSIPHNVSSIGADAFYGVPSTMVVGCYGGYASSWAKKSGFAQKPAVNVFINGVETKFDTPATVINDCTMVPMRAIFEALGATVSWDQATQTAAGVLGDTTISFKINDSTLYKNGQAITLSAPATIVDNRTLVHVRAIAEAFGATVGWDGTNGVVSITA